MSSSQKMTPLDWYLLHQRYQKEQRSNPKISQRAFMIGVGVNQNTGRREFSKISAMIADGMSDKDIKSLLSPASKKTVKSGSKKAKSGSENGSKNKVRSISKEKNGSIKENKNTLKSNTSNDAVNEVNGSALEREQEIIQKERRLTTSLQVGYRDQSSDAQIGDGRFKEGNGAAIRHGGYAQLIHADSDIVQAVTGSFNVGDVKDIIQLQTIQYLNMNRIVEQRLTDIQNLKDSELPKDSEGKAISREDLTRQARWGAAGVLSSVFSSLTMAHTQAAKADADVQIKLGKYHRELKKEQKLIEILGKRVGHEDEITALEVTRELEANGLRPPPLLIAEAMKEIELMAPRVDTNGLSDEEIEAEVQKYLLEANPTNERVRQNIIEFERLAQEAKANSFDSMGGDEDEDEWTGIEHLEGVQDNDPSDEWSY